MVEQFMAAAEAVGGAVKRFTTLDEAIASLKELAAGKMATTSALPGNIRTILDDLAFAPPDGIDRADIGISFALAGAAQTGSLLLDLADPAERSATALPQIHAVFLKASTIVSDLYGLHDILARTLSSSGSSYLSVITGPSRTADIERVLTIGVHGPKELHVLILEGE